ncbi:MAG: DUF2806 domain-containing protein [Pyrinomonadaceae bacterium]|nr:DUF2806 domain-containing protein [Pyrinomonadaceae bacterium]
MGTDGNKGDLIRVKLDATGAELAVGTEAPNLIDRLIPTRYRLNRAIKDALIERVAKKAHEGGELDEQESAFADEFLSQEYRKFLRLTDIQSRAAAIFEDVQDTKLLGSGSETAGTADPVQEHQTGTSEDWVNKFREDAGLVDDEMVREIYSRILAEEAQRPTSISLRTLGVLRYLDHDAAKAFGRLQNVLIDGTMVPQQGPLTKSIYEHAGIRHSDMLLLDDAGLVNASAQSKFTATGASVFISLTNHLRLIAGIKKAEPDVSLDLPVHLLTPAGVALASISDFPVEIAVFNLLKEWVRSNVKHATFIIAKVPFRGWVGNPDELVWETVDPKADSEPRESSQ